MTASILPASQRTRDPASAHESGAVPVSISLATSGTPRAMPAMKGSSSSNRRTKFMSTPPAMSLNFRLARSHAVGAACMSL